MKRPRGITLLFAIGTLAVMFIAVFALLSQTSLRYHQSRLFEDRVQALHAAQAGLIWAQREISLDRLPEIESVVLSADSIAAVAGVRSGEAVLVHVEGRVIRDGEIVASRRLSRHLTGESVP